MVLEYLNRLDRGTKHSKNLFKEDVDLSTFQDLENNHSLTEKEDLK
jgi:hypothetical protein